ncbi:helix-turn-helix domain-containing protein [Streptomyces violaceus]|uniref:Helix-turn-helix domain-containing protein n=1 Tax=Streptomyces violaceus TaxID=1936 RepID=A0ABY9UN83_STRVL|nr:helix-turn-helix domain-containing protein [Streptomyces janthinus]WND24053.1 helix-turn-helix domain-containing protein [Streptomyces janthinus]
MDEYLADIGDRIRAERQARGWAEATLAERAGLDRATVRRIQQGIGSLRVLLQVCSGLGVDADYLLSPAWVMPRSDPRPHLSPTQVDVLREAASGAPLADLASALSMTRSAVSSHLTRIYQQLGVADLPRDQRRAAAVRTAMQYGLFSSPNRTS